MEEGAKVLAVGLKSDTQRLEIAKELGAVPVLAESGGIQEILDEIGKLGKKFADVAYECSGAGSALINAVNVIKPSGVVCEVGIPGKDIPIDIAGHILEEDACRVMNNLAFRVLLPGLAFSNIYGSARASEYGKLMLFAATGYTAALLILMILVPLFVKDNEKCGVVIQGCLHNSFLIFGISLCSRMYPGETPSALAILATVALPVNHIASAMALQFFNNQGGNLKKMVKQITTNPILIACVTAILCNWFGVCIPNALLSVASTLSGAAIPVCLLALGANFHFSSLSEDWKLALAVSFIKLAVLPVGLVWVAARIGIHGMPMLAVLMFFASPTAPVTYTLVASMGGNRALASKIILFSNCLSIASLFCFIYILLDRGIL